MLSARNQFKGTGSGLAADVQFWLDNPSSDFGWILFGEEGSATSTNVKRFDTHENTGAGVEPPTLTIDFTVPEPASFALLGLGGVLLLRRRM